MMICVIYVQQSVFVAGIVLLVSLDNLVITNISV